MGVGLGVRVNVAVGVNVGVNVAVGVGVDVEVGVMVGVGVRVGPNNCPGPQADNKKDVISKINADLCNMFNLPPSS
jgi:hypothetical protein